MVAQFELPSFVVTIVGLGEWFAWYFAGSWRMK
jgi:hypothetical protein